MLCWLATAPGSSPRAWGTPPWRTDGAYFRRFIPTGVGNTPYQKTCCCWSAVHPHGRGEHRFRPRRSRIPHGSSPRAWGTPTSAGHRVHGHRFIPTGVGNTPARCSGASVQRVHPHGRGEHAQVINPAAVAVGSSPRAWGTRCAQCRIVEQHRFIPTGVGNTQSVRIRRRLRAVHPHGRGEHRLEKARLKLACGSSPRAWGTRRNAP